MHRVERFLRAALLVGALAGVSTQASATVIDGANVGSYTTFVDQNTGRVWLDLDTFFGLSHNAMEGLASTAGFSVATRGDVDALLASLPLTGGEWPSYAAIMGSAPNRSLIWGSYEPVTPGIVAWAYSFNGDSSWSFLDHTDFGVNDVPNQDSSAADMNLWAYQDGPAAVPEPGTLLLMASGLAGAALRRRRRA
jgi:hypothetical protein